MKKLLTIVGIVVVVLFLIGLILPHVIDVNHFTHESLAHPEVITRMGKPCFTGSASPFIS